MPISPSMALGTENRKKIITYQLNVETCPNIDAQNNCSIYEKRPLICKAFPFKSGDFSIKCPILSYRKVGEFYCDFVPSTVQVDATEKFDRYISNRFRKYYVKGIKPWDYDLETMKWVLESENNHQRNT